VQRWQQQRAQARRRRTRPFNVVLQRLDSNPKPAVEAKLCLQSAARQPDATSALARNEKNAALARQGLLVYATASFFGLVSGVCNVRRRRKFRGTRGCSQNASSIERAVSDRKAFVDRKARCPKCSNHIWSRHAITSEQIAAMGVKVRETSFSPPPSPQRPAASQSPPAMERPPAAFAAPLLRNQTARPAWPNATALQRHSGESDPLRITSR
jgi:hypothetical protein